jgi:PPOX class probable F420-dependent enzyme
MPDPPTRRAVRGDHPQDGAAATNPPTTTSVPPPAVRSRVAAARVGRLATHGDGDAIHLVPCCFALDPDADCWYWVVDAKPKRSLALRRLDNLDRQPAATLVVDHWDEDWSQLWWVRLDGRGRVLPAGTEDDDRARSLLTAKYAQYQADPPPGAAVRVQVTGWRWWSAAGSW